MNKVTTICFTFLLALAMGNTSFAQNIERVRLEFKAPNGAVRPLLLGFIPNYADDGYNYGFDAMAMVEYSNDLNWMIDDRRCVIQGVGAYSTDKTYPLGMFIEDTGSIDISLVGLENFDEPIDLYIYDSLTGAFSNINETDFSTTVESGEYLDRFHITFQNTVPPVLANESLSIDDNDLNQIVLKSIANTKEILIDTHNNLKIEKVEIIDILGKKVEDIQNISTSKLRIPAQHINSNIIIVSVYTNKGVVRKKLLLL